MSECVKGERVPRRSICTWLWDALINTGEGSALAGMGWTEPDPTGTCPKCGAKPGEVHK